MSKCLTPSTLKDYRIGVRHFFYYAGLAVVHHKKGTRRYYCLSDKYILEKYFTMPKPDNTDFGWGTWGGAFRDDYSTIGLMLGY